MSNLMGVMKVAATGMSAQTVRLNLVASNLSNAESIAATPEQTYRARHPVFSTIQADAESGFDQSPSSSTGVQVTDVVESQAPLRKEFRPEHPLADEKGYITLPNINVVEEMANMISASRSYQTNAELINTAKQMMMQTLNIGRY